MSEALLETEGTWSEIVARTPDFDGKRVRVIVLPIENRTDAKSSPLEAALTEIWSVVPDKSWEKLPADFGDNLDHYLHGTPKRA